MLRITPAQLSREIRGWLGEVISTLQPLLDRSGHTVRVICEDGIVADTYPGVLAQIIRNLALNAAVHGFPDGRAGVIELTVLRLDDGNMRVVVADNATVFRQTICRKFSIRFSRHGAKKAARVSACISSSIWSHRP